MVHARTDRNRYIRRYHEYQEAGHSSTDEHVPGVALMYKQVETDKSFLYCNGQEITPVATLADEFGGRSQIAVDDHCYVLYNKHSTQRYVPVVHWYQEAVEVLQKLPSLTQFVEIPT